jgi:hypothetical protein
MLSYPIVVPMPRRRLPRYYHPTAGKEIRKQLEDYLNKQVVAINKDSPGTVITYAEIEVATGINREIVKLFLFPLTGNHGSITIINPK